MGLRRTTFPPRLLITNATTPGDKIPASGWFRTGQENKARGGAELRNFTGTGTTVFLGVEVANDPRTPDAGYTSLWAAGATANGMKDPDSTAVSLSLSGKLWYRFVWVIYVTSGNGWVTVGGGFAEVLDQ